MRRREFIAVLGGAAAWPLAAQAQPAERLRRIGVLMGGLPNDPAAKLFSAFTQALADLGWTDGRNVQVDLRSPATDFDRMQALPKDFDRMRALAKELVDLQSDIIVANNTPATAALQRETQTIPIVMVGVTEPVGSGFVAALNQPGGNITGFGLYEASLGGKWLELLSEIAPGLKRVAIIFNPDLAPTSLYLPSFETAARSLNVAPFIVPTYSEVDLETAIIALGREPRGGLVVMPDITMFLHRAPIISAAARNNVPAVYYLPTFARDGGLLSYGPDPVDTWRRAATYVDRILRGEKPGDLPVQLPTKYEMVLNLKTAKTLGLTVPPSILLRADEVIE
jgi:putative tryptophan/tyrosine transport system substrate-binding protein